MSEYIILNKTAIQQRIEELEKLYKNSEKPSIQGTIYYKLIEELKQIFSQSIPLFPEIEKAHNAGMNYGCYLQGGSYFHNDNIDGEDYISNLKLDI